MTRVVVMRDELADLLWNDPKTSSELREALRNSTAGTPPPAPWATSAPSGVARTDNTFHWETGSNYPMPSHDPVSVPKPIPKPTAEMIEPGLLEQMAHGNYPPGAWRYIAQITARQIAMWDTMSNSPGESLSSSIEWVRTHSWTAGNIYIPDPFNSNAQIAPGEPGYKAPPG